MHIKWQPKTLHLRKNIHSLNLENFSSIEKTMLSLIEKVIRDNAIFESSKYYSWLPGETPLHSVHCTGITASITVINDTLLSRSTSCVVTLVAANVSGA